MKLLNLGCGERFREGWVNLDIKSGNPLVQACDLRKGIPYPPHTFDAVYHSHLLEHFSKDDALWFIGECSRVLKPGGVIRVVAPDLEGIAGLYLEALEKASQGDEGWRHNYDWMMVELFDQMVREKSGGKISEYTRQKNAPNEEFLRKRLGSFRFPGAASEKEAPAGNMSFSTRLVNRFKRGADNFRAVFLKILLGKRDYEALRFGRLRSKGELHLWMYDRYSLAELLKKAGFRDPAVTGPMESMIEGWKDFHLDAEPDGAVYKPDSIYMEAVKP